MYQRMKCHRSLRGGNGPVPFLTSFGKQRQSVNWHCGNKIGPTSIPNLSLHLLAIHGNDLGRKFDPNGRLGVLIEFVSGETSEH